MPMKGINERWRGRIGNGGKWETVSKVQCYIYEKNLTNLLSCILPKNSIVTVIVGTMNMTE